jgi:hypothetical protein
VHADLELFKVKSQEQPASPSFWRQRSDRTPRMPALSPRAIRCLPTGVGRRRRRSAPGGEHFRAQVRSKPRPGVLSVGLASGKTASAVADLQGQASGGRTGLSPSSPRRPYVLVIPPRYFRNLCRGRVHGRSAGWPTSHQAKTLRSLGRLAPPSGGHPRRALRAQETANHKVVVIGHDRRGSKFVAADSVEGADTRSDRSG